MMIKHREHTLAPKGGVSGLLSSSIVDFAQLAALGYRYGVPEAILDTST